VIVVLSLIVVMAGLVPAIPIDRAQPIGMPGTRPGMTGEVP
jgi:hypothetical protein